MLVQVARNAGATVIGTCGSAEKMALLRELGCAHPVNYREEKFTDVVREVSAGQGCDLVIESVGGDVFEKSLKCLRPRGVLIVLGVASKEVQSVLTVRLLANNWTVTGFHLNEYMKDQVATAKALKSLNTWLDEGKLQIIARHAFPLAQAAAAQQFISDRKSVGKVVLIP